MSSPAVTDISQDEFEYDENKDEFKLPYSKRWYANNIEVPPIRVCIVEPIEKALNKLYYENNNPVNFKDLRDTIDEYWVKKIPLDELNQLTQEIKVYKLQQGQTLGIFRIVPLTDSIMERYDIHEDVRWHPNDDIKTLIPHEHKNIKLRY